MRQHRESTTRERERERVKLVAAAFFNLHVVSIKPVVSLIESYFGMAESSIVT